MIGRVVMWLPRQAEHLLDRLASHTIRSQESLVTQGHDRERRLIFNVAGRFVVGLVAMLGVQWWPDTPWSAALWAVLGLSVGTAAFSPLARASAYKSGWVDGRMRMARQLKAHAERGSTIEDWWETEYLHDAVHVLGLPPTPLPRDDNDG